MTNRAGSLGAIGVTVVYWFLAVLVWWLHPEASSAPVEMKIELIPATRWWGDLTIGVVAPNKAGLIATNIIGLGLAFFIGGLHYHLAWAKEVITRLRDMFGSLTIETR
jgi:hypothetical protein